MRDAQAFPFAVLLALAACSFASSAEYFVDSEAGADKNPGTAPERPWQTLAAVQWHAFKPGDTLRFKCGGTWTGLLVLKSSGAEGNPITLTSYGAGAKPVLRNPPGAKPNWEKCVDLQGSWVVVDGLLLRDTYEFGVQISKDAQHCVVRNCEISNVGIGIGVKGARNVVTHNSIHDLVMVRNTKENPDDDYGAVAVGLFASDNEVSFNRMVNCRAPSFDYGFDGGVVEFYGVVNDCRIYGNFSRNCNGFFEVGGKPGECRNNLVAYNVALNNDGTFAYLHTTGTFGAAIENLRIENNTIVDTEHPKAYLLGFDGKLKEGQVLFRNNIVYTAERFTYGHAVLTHENNLFFRPDGKKDFGIPLSASEKVADPLFRDLAKEDLRLQAGSAARDAGVKLEHKVDLEEKAVPAGAVPDLGAYQFRADAKP